METLLLWFTEHAESAPLIIFGLLMLAGFSLPISEEVMLLISGVLASSVIPDRAIELFVASFLGCYFSDLIAYAIGRILGGKLFTWKWMPFALTEKRMAKLHSFYDRYGFLTLFVGRFIPFGVRNGIFMIAGIGKMHFGKFAMSDFIGCVFFALSLFLLAFSFGKNYDVLWQFISTSNQVLFGIFAVAMIGSGIYLWIKKAPATTT